MCQATSYQYNDFEQCSISEKQLSFRSLPDSNYGLLVYHAINFASSMSTGGG